MDDDRKGVFDSYFSSFMNLFWNPKGESELEAYIQRQSSELNLHMHRASDMREASRFLDENRVRFIFHPTQ
ncbi:hypothetical protein M407DRAFT_19057 [Tulasnella calospora MUT 4182]|uniref:Uncharacterized protein n=1 Tax=Tulasnella calospora MUT 4182 TaxID=1051891 RepID=A0A0C3QSP5_9AGAM|nr:hypothetical protein M407DRAFT_19057 [Tulasnella calospora MUT 4182]